MKVAYTVKGAHEESGVGVRKLWDLIRRGVLETTKVEGRRLIYGESLEALIKNGLELKNEKKPAKRARSLKRVASSAEPAA